MFCKKCGKPIGVDDKFCPHCGAPITDGAAGDDIFPPYTPPMNWYKFLVYFSLIAGAVVSFLGAGLSVLEIFIELNTYLTNIPMLAFNLMYIAVNLAFGFLALATRKALVQYKKKGPFMLYVCYGASALSEVAYAAYDCALNGFTELAIASSVASAALGVLIAAIMIVANYTYFKKRANLFEN